MMTRAISVAGGGIHLETLGSGRGPACPAFLKIFLLAVLRGMAVQYLVLVAIYLRGYVSLQGAR